MTLSNEQARARRIIQQAHLGEKPENWRDYVLRTKAALASHALELIERAEALIEFADRLDPRGDLAQYKADALALDVSEYGDHLDVKEYAKIVQDWPGIATAGGHGYWPPVTPRQEGFQAGFNRDYSPNPYAPGYQQLEWFRGHIAGEEAREEFEADLIAAPQETKPKFRYRLRTTGHSSHKFGPCEVCGEHASEVYCQSEELEYEPGHWTHHMCNDLAGHRACLIGKRR